MMLEVDGLDAYYGEYRALYQVGFNLDEGQIRTLLGANGAGKTTVLRAITAMVRTSGDIRFDGKRVSGRATEDIVRLGIAHVPEGRGTFLRVTVEENLQLGAMTRRDRAGIAADIDQVYAHFPRLKERRTQQAGTLSGGEQQMLAVGRRSGPCEVRRSPWRPVYPSPGRPGRRRLVSGSAFGVRPLRAFRLSWRP